MEKIEQHNMKAQELADMINNRQYGEEVTPKIESFAEQNNLIILFGASDDLVEIRGSLGRDEFSAYGGTTLLLDSKRNKIIDADVLEDDIADQDSEYIREIIRESVIALPRIEVRRNQEGYSWCIYTELPHYTFDILDGEEKYCRGIVLPPQTN